MDCKEVSERNMAEQYLQGHLSDAQQQAFEEHYFDCPDCFAQLRDLRDLQQELGRMAPQVRQERAAAAAAWMPRWAWLGAAAILIIAAGVLLMLRTSSFRADKNAVVKSVPSPKVSPLPALAELAAFEPPAYQPVTLRGSSTAASRSFRAAMELYRDTRYEEAISGLSDATRLDPQDAGSRFFLGICLLLTHRTDAAIDSLRQTIALGDTPYLEEAHFYLAKAFLQRKDIAAARQQLQETINLRGDLENEAKKLLAAVDAVARSPQ